MKYKTTQKDRYGNMRSLEIDTGEKNMEVPPMTSSIPQYEAVGGLAENHPGEPKGSDTVPAWLTPGEFVVNKEATDLFGPQIKQMNDIGREIQDGNISPSEASQIPMYASTGKEVEDRKLKIYKHLANEWGLPDNQIAAIMGQIAHESAGSFDPFRLEDNVPEYKRGEGLFQNTPGATRMLKPYHEYLIKEGIIPKESILIGGSDLLRDKMTEDQAIKSQLDFFMKSFMDFGTTGDKAQRVLPGKNPVTAHGWEKANLMKDAFADTDLRTLAVKTDSNPSLTGGLTSFINVPNDALDARNIATEKMLEEINSGKYSDYNYQEDLGNVPTVINTIPNIEDPSQIPDGGLIVKDIPRPLTSNQSLGDAIMDKVQGGINVVRDRAGNIINWVGDTATGIHNQLHPTQEEMGWKNKGGPIYAYDGIQIPLTRGGGKPWWETVDLFPWSGNQVETEYTSRHPGAGGSPAVPSIPNTIDHGFQQALKGKILNQVDSYSSSKEEAAVPNNEWDINDLEIRDDSTSMTNEDWGSSGVNLLAPPEFPEFYRPADAPAPNYGKAPAWEMRYDNTQPFTSSYDKYVQEEIAGTPAYSIPPVVPPIPVSDWNADPNKITPPKGNPFSFPDYRPDEQVGMDVDSYESIPNIPITDWNADPNKITPPVIPGSVEAEYANKHPGAGGSLIPLGLDPDAYDQETGDLLLPPPGNIDTISEHEAITKAAQQAATKLRPDEQVGMEADAFSKMNLPTDAGLEAQIAEKKKILDMEMKYLTYYRDEKPDAEKLKFHRDIVNKLQKQIESLEIKKKVKKFGEFYTPRAEVAKQEKEDAAKVKSLQAVIDNPNASETEKIIAAKEINELGGETTEEKAKKAAEKKLSDLANNVDDNLNNAINNDLNSADGKKATEDAENKDDDDPEKSKARKMFDFLFGDLIDQGEIGRAIAVYLGSRAMGYDHGSSIGYVARQYLTRIDKKNAAFKKWMLDNTGKYTASSIEKFKKTGNPAHLIPIGAKPRSQGRSKMMYHPDLRSEGMAYEFKVKNSQGEDETFWSFDPTGQNDKLRVGVGWTDKNVLDVGTEEINLVKDMLVGMQNKIDKEVTGKKDNKRTKYWSSNSDVPGLIPAAAAGEVAQWLHERGIPPGKYQTAIAEAYTALINSNKRKVRELGSDKAEIESSLIPYLQEATVKVRLEDMTFINEEGKTELIPSPAVAMLDGKKRVMNTKLLVDLEKKIDMVFPAGTADRFWAQAAQSWIKDADVRKEFIASAKTKEFKEYTPFALWAEYLLQSEIERAAKETAQ